MPFHRWPFQCIFFNENVLISIKISLQFVPQGPIDDISALAQIMAWRRPGDKPLSEPLMVRLPTHTCVTLPHWVKEFSGEYIYILKAQCVNISNTLISSISTFIVDIRRLYLDQNFIYATSGPSRSAHYDLMKSITSTIFIRLSPVVYSVQNYYLYH